MITAPEPGALDARASAVEVSIKGAVQYAIIHLMSNASDRRTLLYGALGFAGLGLVSLVGYALLAWSIRFWITPALIIAGSVAAVCFPAVGMALGRAITTGRPHDERTFALAAGGAFGAVCLFFGAVGYLWFSLLENL
ncbi:hypothetical protein [Nonomuraea angiospora]|uniref:hypothetical protein n=1 Tax=Nonomuraea angiospora TaxID=46172 RepID=UPI0029B38C65|nr:hypothetical protein [Nonomuraea angiospora]MDX3101073.1 hypothetical protein [Nonomuraea angiospora]